MLIVWICADIWEIDLKQSPWGNGDEFLFSLNNIPMSSEKVNSLCQLGF